MTNPAGARDVLEGRADVMIGEFHAALVAIRHVAIGARNASLGMNPCAVGFVIGMLRFEHRSLAERMHPIDVADFIVVGFHLFGGEALVPRKGEIFALAPEVILDVALRADKRAHLLVRGLCDVQPAPLPGLGQCRPSDAQVHCLRVVAILTAYVVHHLRAEFLPRFLVELGDAHLIHQPRDVRALARPACAGLRNHRAQCVANVRDRVVVSARLEVFARKGIAGPHHNVLRVPFQQINLS